MENKFEPHIMYDPKTGKSYKANKEADHIRMKKMGYVHDKPTDIEEDAPSGANVSSVDMNPTGGNTRLKSKPMTRFQPAFDKRYKGKNLLLTKFRQHAYGNG